jgi:hypothetical protein
LFVGKARSLSLSGTPEKSFASVGSRLTCKHYTILERLARDKHSAAGTGREKDKKIYSFLTNIIVWKDWVPA